MTTVEVALNPHKENLLGFDILADKQWYLPSGTVWSLDTERQQALM